MNRSDLISAIKKEAELTNNESEKIVNEFFGAITQTLANNERVEIRGFGAISEPARHFITHRRHHSLYGTKSGSGQSR